jgi:hypothetical protein
VFTSCTCTCTCSCLPSAPCSFEHPCSLRASAPKAGSWMEQGCFYTRGSEGAVAIQLQPRELDWHHSIQACLQA